MTASHPGSEAPRPAVSGSHCDAGCTSVPRLAATSATLGRADLRTRQHRHGDTYRDSPRRIVALLFQCSPALGTPPSLSVEPPENSQGSPSNFSTRLRKLRDAPASGWCKRKEILKQLHYRATDSMESAVTSTEKQLAEWGRHRDIFKL